MNYYIDNPSLKFHLNHPLMRRIVELKERDYTEKDNFDYAPQNFEDAMDSYDKVLETVGVIAGDIIAQNAESVDKEGPHELFKNIVLDSSLHFFELSALFQTCNDVECQNRQNCTVHCH